MSLSLKNDILKAVEDSKKITNNTSKTVVMKEPAFYNPEFFRTGVIEVPRMDPIWLQAADYDRIVNLSKRLHISETEVIQAALKCYEDCLDAVDKSRNNPAAMSFEVVLND